MLATCDVYRAHRHGSESPHPGSTPGLNPCNHLTRQACGPWRTHRHNTYIQARRLRRHEELMIHRIRRAAQPRRRGLRHKRGHHRAEGAEAVAAEAGAVWAGEAPGVAGRERGNVATSGRQQQRGPVGGRSQGPSGPSGRAWLPGCSREADRRTVADTQTQ